MPTSATGRWKNSPPSPRAAAGGFTLVEILVVVVIIGILSVGAVLSLGVIGGDRELDRERERVLAITGYLRDQAALQNREYGMRLYTGGYEFLVYDGLSLQWARVTDDPLLRPRTLPAGLTVRLLVEGRPVVLPAQDKKDPTPQIMLFSSGEMSSFELTLRRDADDREAVLVPSPTEDAIVEKVPAEGAT